MSSQNDPSQNSSQPDSSPKPAASDAPTAGTTQPLWRQVIGDRHFLVAVVLLLSFSVGWDMLCKAAKWATHKDPVPWPAAVTVDPKTFRLTSLPKKLGEFVLFDTPGKDGKPMGELEFNDDLMESLKIGTAVDKQRHKDRCSNWYIARTYRDTTLSSDDPRAYWRLEVYYYTGDPDKVPHVPERCGAASGAEISNSQPMSINVVAAQKPWDDPFNVQRVEMKVTDAEKFSTYQQFSYYVFSLNGSPEEDWADVRGKLLLPTMRYCYFAKIQFTPLRSINDPAEADQDARRFANNFLPSVLAMLPMPSDVEQLKMSKKSD